jgi:F-type H+-transporting ATPase subunit delta
MNTFRIARAAVRARPAAIARPIQRRGYAEVASDKIKLSLALPHQVRITSVFRTRYSSIEEKTHSGIELTNLRIVRLQVPGCVCLAATLTDTATRTRKY